MYWQPLKLTAVSDGNCIDVEPLITFKLISCFVQLIVVPVQSSVSYVT